MLQARVVAGPAREDNSGSGVGFLVWCCSRWVLVQDLPFFSLDRWHNNAPQLTIDLPTSCGSLFHSWTITQTHTKLFAAISCLSYPSTKQNQAHCWDDQNHRDNTPAFTRLPITFHHNEANLDQRGCFRRAIISSINVCSDLVLKTIMEKMVTATSMLSFHN